jgi:hypothetical protein
MSYLVENVNVRKFVAKIFDCQFNFQCGGGFCVFS